MHIMQDKQDVHIIKVGYGDSSERGYIGIESTKNLLRHDNPERYLCEWRLRRSCDKDQTWIMQQRAKDRSATDAAGLEEELDKKVSWRRPGLLQSQNSSEH